MMQILIFLLASWDRFITPCINKYDYYLVYKTKKRKNKPAKEMFKYMHLFTHRVWSKSKSKSKSNSNNKLKIGRHMQTHKAKNDYYFAHREVVKRRRKKINKLCFYLLLRFSPRWWWSPAIGPSSTRKYLFFYLFFFSGNNLKFMIRPKKFIEIDRV